MFGNKETGKITFYYDNAKVFNDISMLSAYMTKNMSLESGSAIDEFNISEDEKDVYAVCVKQALPNIYEILMKLCSGIDNAFSDSVEVLSESSDDLGRSPGTYIEFTINDNAAFNKNVLALVDATINDCIYYGVLAAFYSINTNAALQNLSQGKFANNLLLLNQRLYQLKKRTTNSIY